MSNPITITLDLPNNWKQLRLPRALNERLQELLDRLDESGRLSARERREAQALVELNDLLSLMKAQAALSRTRRQQ